MLMVIVGGLVTPISAALLGLSGAGASEQCSATLPHPVTSSSEARGPRLRG
jgi:hypothetical protein